MKDNTEETSSGCVACLALLIALVSLGSSIYTYYTNSKLEDLARENNVDVAVLKSDIVNEEVTPESLSKPNSVRYNESMTNPKRSYIVAYSTKEKNDKKVEKKVCVPVSGSTKVDDEWLTLLGEKIAENNPDSELISIKTSSQHCWR